jgi:hypothetical protein
MIYKCPVVVHVNYFLYLSDCSIQLILRYYFDNTDYNTQLISMYSNTATCFELMAHHQGVLNMMSCVLMINNTHVDCENITINYKIIS